MKRYFVTFDKTTVKFIRVGIMIALLVMLLCGGCVLAFTVNQWRNSNRLVEVQIDYQKRLTEQVGKDINVNQIYNTKSK
jgi:ABC-type Zn uptake system ZnuABC Zn-binding protein ZnuA